MSPKHGSRARSMDAEMAVDRGRMVERRSDLPKIALKKACLKVSYLKPSLWVLRLLQAGWKWKYMGKERKLPFSFLKEACKLIKGVLQFYLVFLYFFVHQLVWNIHV